MLKRGFSLAELMVAVLLASLLSLSLFQLLSQTRRIVRRIVHVIEVDEPLVAFYQQLQKDVTGMFAPQSSIEFYAAADKKAEEAKKATQAGKTPPPQKTEAPKEQEVPIKPVMVVEKSGDAFYWSFITTGALQLLNPEGSVDPTSFLRRVSYVLEPDPQRPHLRRLMYRFSKDKLQAQELKGAAFAPSYELLPGIKDIAFEFTLFELEEKKEGAQQPQAKPAPPKISVVKEWNEEEVWKKSKALIPAYIKISGTVVDVANREYPFELFMKVPAYAPYKPKEETLAQRIERIATDIFGKK